MQKMQIEQEEFNKENNDTPEKLAMYFRYYKQYQNQNIIFHLPLNNIPYKTYYKKYQKYFIKLSEICQKYKINPENYIKFCVFKRVVNDVDAMLNVYSFKDYATEMEIEEQYKKIFTQYTKSAEYVANECIKKNITPVEFIKELILKKQLAYEYICGNLSMYYIATIRNIEKLCEYLDQNSIDELRIILDVKEKLNQDVQDVFMKFKNKRISPIKLSEEIIKSKIN